MPARDCSAVFGGADRQRFENVAAEAPAVGMADVVDPALDAGVQLGEADLARRDRQPPVRDGPPLARLISVVASGRYMHVFGLFAAFRGKPGAPGHDGMRGSWSQSIQRPRRTCRVRGVPIRLAPSAVTSIVLASTPDAPTGSPGTSLSPPSAGLASGYRPAGAIRFFAHHQSPGYPRVFGRQGGDRHGLWPTRHERVEPGIAGLGLGVQH